MNYRSQDTEFQIVQYSQTDKNVRHQYMTKIDGEIVDHPTPIHGGSGFIGSWIIRLLLSRGYTVHATVKDLGNPKETKHLKVLLDEARVDSSCLQLFQLDLLNYETCHAAVRDTSGVFHVASPCTLERLDPQKELLDPAVKGTINVLRSARECGISRVIVTSSVAAIMPSPDWSAHVPKVENCWTDVEYCKKKELWYLISKTLAEKAASEFGKENGMDVIIVNPGTVLGHMIQLDLNASMAQILHLLQVNHPVCLWLMINNHGSAEEYCDIFMGPIHVKDVALAHILVYENQIASGRHLCIQSITHWSDFAAKVVEMYPDYKLPCFPKDTQPGLLRVSDPSKKLIELGIEFTSMEQIIKDSVESLKARGYLSTN
ncbi:Cinnamoyl-CoA reductase [Zostera marina]|uniref:Cinnamoyl-CoA reductase n=1 Tax=Zostera marina TaxID=29655 RepID=A0A0K9PED3_ZOSMR|nr:Cinnamoyl-CoA reductase [Zostera marina]